MRITDSVLSHLHCVLLKQAISFQSPIKHSLPGAIHRLLESSGNH
jgi:hypothetical protein